MEFKGTPGPWIIEADEDDPSQLDIVTDNRPYVATVWPDAFDLSEEQLANAHLIAAAPELLEALEEIVDYRGGAANALEDEYVMDRVSAAIAKALGQL